MKSTVTANDFVNAFERYGRADQFGGRDGLWALFDYLESYESDAGEELELDVIALCCDFTHYSDLAEFNYEQGMDCESLDDVAEHTTVIDIDGEQFIAANF